MKLITEIFTSQGVTECIIKRHVNDLFEVDLWRGSTFLKSEYTVFRAGVFMKWTGTRYVIIRTKPENYSNEYWLELENLISNTIIINE